MIPGAPIDNLTTFGFPAGRRLGGKYEVLALLGSGWEGEVYWLRELATGVECTGKLFFPKRNPKGRTARRYAQRLHKLRRCKMVIQYQTTEHIPIGGTQVELLVSELSDGELLSDYLKRQPRKRLPPFQALHLLHALATGLEEIHAAGEYHGDIHAANVLVERAGLTYDLRLIDFFDWGPTRRASVQYDVVELVRVFHEALGGAKAYASLPGWSKQICRGMKRSLILSRFRDVSALRRYVEELSVD